jgi:hypothetical protein
MKAYKKELKKFRDKIKKGYLLTLNEGVRYYILVIMEETEGVKC